MTIHRIGVDEALESLHSGPSGLSADEAARRLLRFGPNQVQRLPPEPGWRRWTRPFRHFFALILWVAAGLAFAAELRQPGSGMATLGVAIIGVIVVNGLFSLWQETRAEGAILALQRLLPNQAKALRDGRVVPLAVEALVPGDVLVLEAGDAIPADGRVIQSFGAAVNNAVLTGESTPQPCEASVSDAASPLLARNVLLAGATLVSGEARALVYATGGDSEFGRIVHLTQTAEETESPLVREIRVLSRWIAVLATALGVVFYFVGRAAGLPFWANFIFAIGIIVANVPEGLLPTLTMALALGAQRMARRRALVRHLPSVQTLGSATVICTDKTGTLTLNRMTPRRLYVGGRSYGVPGNLSTLVAPHPRFFRVARSCHSLKEGQNGLFGDPLDVGLVTLATEAAPDLPDLEREDVIPFDSDRRRLSVLGHAEGALELCTKGALEAILPICVAVQTEGESVPLDASARARFLRAEEEMATEGLRVIALAGRDVTPDEPRHALETSLTLLGLVGFEDPPRPEVPAAVQTCRGAGIRAIMVTGDHPRTALALARSIGLVPPGKGRVLTGRQLEDLSDAQLQLQLGVPDILFARVTADQKMRIVRVLKAMGETVAVTGDGVNDAPALRLADIGIAMGVSGTDVARQSADMVLLDDNFASIVAAVEEGRAVYANIRKFLTYILTSNVPELVPYLAFALFRIPLPLTVIQILTVDLGTDMVPALGLGAEPPRADLMKRPPAARSEHLLDPGVLARAYLLLGPIEAAAAMAAYGFVLREGGWRFGESLAPRDPLYLQATTACLAAIVATQIANVHLCRDAHASIRRLPFFGNPIITAGIAAEIAALLFIVYTPLGNAVFGTAPLGGTVWLWIGVSAVAMLLIEEARKAWVRGRERREPREAAPAASPAATP